MALGLLYMYITTYFIRSNKLVCTMWISRKYGEINSIFFLNYIL